MTISEELFARFCERACLRAARVVEGSASRPDFFVVGHSGREIVVEVKQFDPNAEERKALERIRSGQQGGFRTTPGQRIRAAISTASKQLKALSKGDRPALLVVYNNVYSRHLHTDPYAVLTAMRGLDTVSVTIPRDPSLSPYFGEPRPGPKKKFTSEDNTSISGIGVLHTSFEDSPLLNLYHNPHAALPLSSGDFCHDSVFHYWMTRDQSNWQTAPPSV